jgi:hypothetical protein
MCFDFMILKYVFLYLSVALCTKTETIIVLITFQSLIIMIKKEYETPKCEMLEFSSFPIMTSGLSPIVLGISTGEDVTVDSEYNPW